MKNLKLGLLSVALCSSLFAGNYKVDTSHSNAGFSVKHMMVSNVIGKFNDFKGTFEFDEKNGTLLSLNGELSVSSIDTANEKRDNHLKADDFFAAKNFPTITFKSTKVEKDTIYGDLTIKGKTQNVKFSLENGGAFAGKAGFSLKGSINRSDFGITWNKVLEAGAVAVGDQVKLIIDIEGDLVK
ncbi:MAG TPA: YceI family protein [Aliarcobacter thereius]|uniref:YceI family protein n=1 Tax=Aliarcobacter thereius TaxID=544718 RepID=A0A5R9H1J4_9BACT|nr:YceI family protein [Aliarcobacter thereius]TLS72575.1 YceI family protein [Aliarcobacter thereius]HJE03060.1 YceI family protein [Aliarcobacter thereius]